MKKVKKAGCILLDLKNCAIFIDSLIFIPATLNICIKLLIALLSLTNKASITSFDGFRIPLFSSIAFIVLLVLLSFSMRMLICNKYNSGSNIFSCFKNIS